MYALPFRTAGKDIRTPDTTTEKRYKFGALTHLIKFDNVVMLQDERRNSKLGFVLYHKMGLG